MQRHSTRNTVSASAASKDNPPIDKTQAAAPKPRTRKPQTPKTDPNSAVLEPTDGITPQSTRRPGKKGQANSQGPANAPGSVGTVAQAHQPVALSKQHPKSKKLPPKPREPLPDRGTPRQNIGAPDKKRAKRTSQQVLEDAERKRAMQEQLREMETQKMKLIAEMELHQAQVERDEEAVAVELGSFEHEFRPEKSPSLPDDDIIPGELTDDEDFAMDETEEPMADIVEGKAAVS